MRYQLDKKSGNELSVLGFGCMRLPLSMGRVDLSKAEIIMMEAIDKGVNFFDTAYIYPGSEVALGYVIDKNKVRHKVYIATKLPLFKCNSYDDFDKIFCEQLNRLKTDYIDYYFMHSVSQYSDWERMCELGIEKWIEEKKSQGKIKQLGFSFHGTRDEFFSLLDAYDWDFCMIQYNYINVHYQAGVDGLKKAHAKGLPVFIMEPLLGGRLANALPEKAAVLLKEYNPEATPASWALRWLWSQSEVTLLISGMNELGQVNENTALAEQSQIGGMTAEELTVIDQAADILASSYKVACTGCNYCLPCPAKINIPDSFMAYNTSYSIGRLTGMHQYITTAGGFIPVYSVANCIKCGKCEKLCPQKIPIIETLKDVRSRMEPWWLRAVMALGRKIMK